MYFDAAVVFTFIQIGSGHTVSKKLSFSTSPKAEQFPSKLYRLVIGLVQLIDAKGIDVAQPIWL